MLRLQLYIEGNRVDLFDDEQVTINSSIQNIRDIAKVFTEFTKSFSIPASKSNNKIFKHYYNFDITDGFDARIKKSANIELSNTPFKEGKIKLDSVSIKNGVVYSYKISFVGNTVNINDLFTDDKLGDIATTFFSQFDQVYTAATVLAGLQNPITVGSYTDALVVPLITTNTRLFYDSGATTEIPYSTDGRINELGGNLFTHSGGGDTHYHGVYYEELKYALRLDIIIRAIEEHYNITFSSDFFNSTNSHYYDLYMWLHRKAGFAFDTEPQTLVDTFTTGTTTFAGGSTVVSDGGTFKLTAEKKILTINISMVSSVATDEYSILIAKNGTIVSETFIAADASSPYIGTAQYLDSDTTFTDAEYQVFIKSNSTLNFTTSSYIDFGLISILIGGSSGNATINLASTMTVDNTQKFIVQQQIPNIKVIDFLTSLFKMFNLTAYEKDGVIYVQTLDDFYNGLNGVQREWNLTSNLNLDYEVLPSLPFREVDFAYKGLKTFLARNHEETFKVGWGTEEYDINSDESGTKYDALGGVYKVEPKFEHMKYERLLDANDNSVTTIQVGWSVNEDKAAYVGEPLLFYPIKRLNGTAIRFLELQERSGTSFQDIDDYHIPSNSQELSAIASSNNINFSLEQNEYAYADNLDFSNTLFNVFYKAYIQKSFSSKNRITRLNGVFPSNFILDYRLSDKIIYRDKRYIINNIKINLNTGKGNVELLTDVKVANELIISAEANTALDACALSSITRRIFYNLDENFANGVIVYENESLSIPFDGNDKFYKIDQFGLNQSIRVSSVGLVSSYTDC